MKRGTRRKVVVVAVGALCSITWLLRQRYSLGLGSAPISSQQLLEPTIFHNIHDHGDFPPLRSSGPTVLNPNIPGSEASGGKGLYQFDNVCLTRHAKWGNMQGLVYLEPGNDEMARNDHRCVPCSRPINHNGGWWGKGRDQKEVGHICGFQGTHAMFATNVSDLSACMQTDISNRKFEAWGQHYVPSRIETVHYFNESILSINFDEGNIGHDLFDYMFSYLPHWYEFRKNNTFPFRGVVSHHSYSGCLSNSNTYWFCEILRAMDAFGGAPELPPEPDNTTLYCFKSLVVTHLSLQRSLRVPGLLTKEIFDTFREILFEKFDLPRDRDIHHKDVGSLPAEGRGTSDASRTNRTRTILFYAHEPSGRRVWNGMYDLIHHIKDLPKYSNVKFDYVYDFGALSIREQAFLFNGADILIMAHGAQMVNSLFSVDKTFFVEMGCYIPTFVGNKNYQSLIDGHHKYVQRCSTDSKEDSICVVCPTRGDHTYNNFTMTNLAFELLIDTVLEERW